MDAYLGALGRAGQWKWIRYLADTAHLDSGYTIVTGLQPATDGSL